MLQNAYFPAKISADTAENEQHFADILPKTGNYPTGRSAGQAKSAAASADASSAGAVSVGGKLRPAMASAMDASQTPTRAAFRFSDRFPNILQQVELSNCFP